MFNVGNYQYTNSNSYLGQLGAQLKHIESLVEGGREVRIRLVFGDHESVLTFKGVKSFELSPAVPAAAEAKRPSLADNEGLVPSVQGSFGFDLGEAQRQVPAQDAHPQAAPHSKLMVSEEEIAARIASGLPLTDISQMGSHEYFVRADCTYKANDGYTITAKANFRTDLASIPKILLPFISVQDLSVTAPVFHDLIYRTGGDVVHPAGEVVPAGKLFRKDEADDLFLELMTREKVGYFKRNFAYGAVILFGGSAWKGR